MAYTLFYSPGACSLAPHILLEETGQVFDLKLVSSSTGATRRPEHLRINPKGRVPVLADGDWVLTEAPAILLHIALGHPEFLPTEPDGLPRAIEWLNYLSGTVHSVSVRSIWRTENFSDDPAARETIVAKGRETLRANFAFIENRMDGRDYAVADAYSFVDPFLLVIFRWGNRMGVDMAGTYPAWTRHARALEARPAVQRTIAKEGISLWA